MTKRDQIQQNALIEVIKYKRSSAVMSMGSGKTKLGLMHMQYYLHDQSRYLVVAPKRSIFQSWIDDCKKFECEELLEHITFTTYLSLSKNKTDYDCVYLDEMHSLLDTHLDWLNSYRGRILGLTGTAPKRGSKADIVYKYCPVKFTYTVDTAIDDKILNDYEIHVHTMPLDTRNNIKKESKKTGIWYTSEHKQYSFWNSKLQNASSDKEVRFLRIMRMKTLMSLPSKEKYATHLMNNTANKCIVFANTKEQADKLCRYSYYSGNKKSEDNLQKFKDGTIDRLSCVLQLNEGINIPNLKEGIILHSYSNERKSNQRIGRLLRLNPDEKSIIHVLCYSNTIDETWVKEALSDLDQSKITWKNVNQLQLEL